MGGILQALVIVGLLSTGKLKSEQTGWLDKVTKPIIRTLMSKTTETGCYKYTVTFS